ncbi:4-hydroxybutyrate dehydrogenase [Aureimonas ureilytica]|uniref:4-hydroxybutyrate dehydrogenase n=1 Tax=Aureimonas ureilytica TaxID=401562 RepID=A0A175RR37_9HYPH|nr:iron-containing alcohol dehydrogenase [Aureimonas ureilytica]KTR06275.1 4-hydroxybutyrate dehydrogenase [Aureimonas ureilytica]
MALINYITRVQFGYGMLATLTDELPLAGIGRALVVTDKPIAALGLIDRIRALVGDKVAGVFDETPGNPNEAAVRAATELFRSAGADGLIAIGGGSVLDLAKAVAVMAAHDGPLKTFAAIEGGTERISARTFPMVAIPTTSGTGSEVGRGAILILEDGRKVGLLSNHLVPKVAICDPELTLSLPAHLTAATGMDAISHCIETYLSAAFNPPADGIALEGLRRAWAHLATATAEPDNRDARANMSIAATMGAMCFQKGLGCVHSLSHSLGGLNPRLHHGTLNAVFLPAVLEFNRSAPSSVAEGKFDRLAHAMGLSGADDVVPAIEAMTRRIGLPGKLSELGVEADLFPAIIAGALKDHCHKTNPREASPQDYEAMLARSL